MRLHAPVRTGTAKITGRINSAELIGAGDYILVCPKKMFLSFEELVTVEKRKNNAAYFPKVDSKDKKRERYTDAEER